MALKLFQSSILAKIVKAWYREWISGTFLNADKKFGLSVRLPDLCIFFHSLAPFGSHYPALTEANKMLVPIMALVDTDANPNIITYPIPANDDSPSSVGLFGTLFVDTICRAKQLKEEIDSLTKI
ncbi:hypothetical protein ACOME3_004188 [Neoechinorhynchus agilis]